MTTLSMYPSLVVLAVLCAASCAVALPGECSNAGSIPALPSGTTLKQALVYIRHGDRSLSSEEVCWPNDNVVYSCGLNMLQANDESSGPSTSPALMFRREYEPNFEFIPGSCGIGQLTPTGYAQELQNGAAVRSVYIEAGNLLPSVLNNAVGSLLYLRSDDSQRTIMSGQALVTGMYPAAFANVSNAANRVLTWFVRDSMYENVYPNTESCPAVAAAYQAALFDSDEAKALYAKGAPLFSTISQIVGRKFTSDDQSPLDAFDCTFTHLCHGFSLPTGFNNTLVDGVFDFASELYVLLNTYNSSAFAKAGMASLVSDSVNAMKKMMAGGAAQPFLLFSGHDTGPIIPLLAAFGVWDGLWPTYASMITLELHQMTASPSQYAVRFTYAGNTLMLPGCSDSQGLCAWPKFLTIAQEIISYGSSCATPPPPAGIMKRYH